jgi:hypothetical protein
MFDKKLAFALLAFLSCHGLVWARKTPKHTHAPVSPEAAAFHQKIEALASGFLLKLQIVLSQLPRISV